MNIRSLVKHYKDVLADYKILQKDVICFQETWLFPEQEKNCFLDGYTHTLPLLEKEKDWQHSQKFLFKKM